MILSLFVPASCVPLVPEQGTVGASGDLAPLAHLALGMMGEGRMWSPKSGWAEAKDVSLPFTNFPNEKYLVVKSHINRNNRREAFGRPFY